MVHGIDKYRSRRNRALIRELFMREWDPIGMSDAPEAQDEYDRYVAKAYVMLMDEGASREEIASYLRWAEEDWMGLAPADLARIARVVDALFAMLPLFKADPESLS
ncbi:MAG: hypothetical protein ACLQU2_32640 [Candidatus Binataceae bacterium]